ncbi:DsbC, partial [Pasteurella multocida subsp. multocida str. Anand1_cattle]
MVFFYITEDAKYILDGKLHALSEKGLRDVSSSLLLDKLTAYKNEMVVYPAKDEKTCDYRVHGYFVPL